MPLNGSWFWCRIHYVAEFVLAEKFYYYYTGHDRVGPYPTLELAVEFGQKVWGEIKEDGDANE